MRAYAQVLVRPGGFGRLWLGTTVSLLGDGMTFLALAWLVLDEGGAGRLGLLGVCFTAPVVVGGPATGLLLDRYDKRTLLIADSVFRAVCVASVPLTAAFGGMPAALPFVVAVVYGLLKMVPLAGFPAAIPQLVDDENLDTANALESLAFSVSTVVGPALAGVLIGAIGAADVLLVDAASYLVLAALAATVRQPLSPPARTGNPARAKPSLRSVAGDRVIVATTAAFMLFNIAEGMLLLVVGPWLARHQLGGGASTLGALTAALAAGEVVGAALAGRGRPGRASPRLIGLCQAAAGPAFLAVLGAPSALVVGAGYFAVGALSAPMTVWAQSMRMRRIPPALHGRAFTALRTIMQATPPLGSVLAAPLLARGELTAAAVIMAGVAGLPGLWLMLAVVDTQEA
ncbi:MFS transporter [Streptomyces sp. NBS 14/10]|uniref:MFS transporter n=1 Tax=Streptomyces sp. NBS 14/10 TaxID=1945643 RepID=UPI00211B295E|nr:MFS transporter [Streptomyces sp. NBS 14/10]KAK1180655.1 MFS transporter [Streptomyces sp. NBS 14/10]